MALSTPQAILEKNCRTAIQSAEDEITEAVRSTRAAYNAAKRAKTKLATLRGLSKQLLAQRTKGGKQQFSTMLLDAAEELVIQANATSPDEIERASGNLQAACLVAQGAARAVDTIYHS